jgi:hypothetical protein
MTEYKRGEWRWELWPMTFGKYRLVHTDGLNAHDFYCMKNIELGVQAQRNMVCEGIAPTEGYTRKCVDGVIMYPEHDFRHSESCMRCGQLTGEEDDECTPREN